MIMTNEQAEQMLRQDMALIQQEDDLMAEALEYGRIQQAMVMLDLELGIPKAATPRQALAIFKYALRHQHDLYRYEDETILAAQQERI